jgi:hypothetical protein
MSTLFHCFLAGHKQPQAEISQGWLWLCEGFCAATRAALDLFGAVATFACEEGRPAQLSDQVLAITFNTLVIVSV